MKNQLAFPQPEPIVNEFHKDYGKDRGMTLRDYFAAKAMTGLLTAEIVGEYTNEHVAEISYRIADAMIEARDENNR
ncbi:MAG: hypothetical protein ACOVKL_03750 [Polynucleobacter sp.]